MFHLPEQFKEKEVLYQRLILFALITSMVVIYFKQILDIVAYILAICTPFILGAFLAFIFNIIANGLVDGLGRLCHVRESRLIRFLCNVGALLIVAAVVILFLFLILPHAIDSFQTMMETMPDGLNSIYNKILVSTEKIPYIHNWFVNMQTDLTDVSGLVQSLISWVVSGGANDLVGSIYNIISTTFSWILTIFVALAFSIILLFNKKKAITEVKMLSRAYLSDKNYEKVRHFVNLVKSTFVHYISGTCTECLILGTLVTCFSLIFHLPYSFLCGIVVAIGALVPMFGALAAAILMSLFIAVSSVPAGISFFIMFICIQNVEGNFIYPHVVGKFVEFPPMYVIIAITVGANLAGIAGMIISIPVCSIFYQLLMENAQERLEAKKLRKERRTKTV
jgi:predicted PurR-regulated permease PerM